MTRLAIEQGVSGRVTPGDAGESGRLATLIDEPSPFAGMSGANLSTLLIWLNRVRARQPDIILLDYGTRGEIDEHPHRIMLQSLSTRSLLIAAAGNKPKQVIVPGAYPEVLAVGALDKTGIVPSYSGWNPKLRKPELFMLDDLASTPLSLAIKAEMFTEGGLRGSSFSALHAVAAAALVWSILPELSPRGIRALLLEACRPLSGPPGRQALTVSDAVELARRRVVERTLRAGPCSMETLSAITGLDLRVLAGTIRSLIAQQRVFKLTSGRLERFQLQ
jgi:subtilisin family serine protease